MEDGLIKHTEILLRFGGDPHYADPKGRNVLDIAGERGYSDIVALLLAHDLTLVDLAGVRACGRVSQLLLIYLDVLMS